MGSLGSEKRVISPSLRADGERSTGRAAILGIGTAVPGHEVIQNGFADYYFNLSNCNHMDSLKDKLARICEKSMIERRYIALNDDMVKANPNMAAFRATSLDVRQELMETELPFLAAEAARKAIADWGRPASGITHIVFSNNGGSAVPGPDYELVKLLGLPFSTNRFMLYQQGCVGGATAIRLAKDISENNRGARVLVVCCEVTSIAGYRGPSESHVETLVGQALFGDGAGALIIGAPEDTPHGSEVESVERPIFEIVWASQSIIPESQGAITVRITEAGLLAVLQSNVAQCIAAGVEKLASEALAPIGAEGDLNAVFWVVHPGGPAILDQVETKLELGKEKLQASREVLRNYGNMSSPTLFFVMETMRKRSEERGLSTAGEGLEWGVLLGFGPGITAETAVLRCPRV